MKIVIAGLISLFLFSCQHAEPSLASEIKIELFSLAKDKRFASTAANRYEYQMSPNQKIKIFRYAFSNIKESAEYMLNRRMLLHRLFESHVEPYIGLLTIDKSCLSDVDVKGNLIEVNSDTEYFYMKLPINKYEAVEGCDDARWGQVVYSFYNCKKSNEVFEVRYVRNIDSETIDVQAECSERN